MRKLILFSIFMIFLAGCGKKNTTYIYVTIPRGANLDKIAAILKKNRIITNETTFKIMAKLQHKDKKLKSGIYKLKKFSSTKDVINILSEGKSENIKITIPEGFTLEQIYPILKSKFGISKTDYTNYTHDRTILKHYRIQGSSLEGYMFPDTYLFNASATLDEIVKIFLNRFNDVFTEESIKYWHILRRPRYKIIIMASLIQAEARYKSEMPLIASVYYNRLRKGYRLECDPTVIYALGKHKNRLTYKDLKIDSPYNTYKYYGLPPGPICNPGRDAIDAAMSPARTKYLYFVADINGHHLFAKSLKEHNKNIRIVKRHKKSLRK